MKKLSFIILSFCLLINLNAQDQKPEGARSVKVLKFLLGKTITEAKSILLKFDLLNSTEDIQKNDEDLNVDIYAFFNKNIKQSEKEDELMFYLACKNDKVLFVSLSFEFEDEKQPIKVLKKMIEQLTNESYIQEKEKFRTKTSGNGMSSAKYLSESYWFKNNFSKSSAFIINDNYENFIIGLGNPSFLQKFHDLNLN